MRFEINFIWDCQDPSEINVREGVSVLDNIKIWHNNIPGWLRKMGEYFSKYPQPGIPAQLRPRDIYINLWLGPHLSDTSRRKIQAWAAGLSRLRLININPEWNITATYVAKPPFWNPGNASDIWRVLILSRSKEPGEEDVVRIYMDADNNIFENDNAYVDSIKYYSQVNRPLPSCMPRLACKHTLHLSEIENSSRFFVEIENKIHQAGVMFYGNIDYLTKRILLCDGNSVLVVFDIEKFKRYFANELLQDNCCWITWPKGIDKVVSLSKRIRYLMSVVSSLEFYGRHSVSTPFSLTLQAAGPTRLHNLFSKFFSVECDRNVALSYDTLKKTNFLPMPIGIENLAKYFLVNTGILIGVECSAWLCRSIGGMGHLLLRAKTYATIDELAHDIADRIDFEIRHFREYNLPYGLLLALHYHQLVNETNIVRFAGLVFDYLFSKMMKHYPANPALYDFETIVEVKDFDWLMEIIDYHAVNGIPYSDALKVNIFILQDKAVDIQSISQVRRTRSTSYLHAREKEGISLDQHNLYPPKEWMQYKALLLPKYRAEPRGFKKLNTAQKNAWNFIAE